jgi:hypothetical protein
MSSRRAMAVLAVLALAVAACSGSAAPTTAPVGAPTAAIAPTLATSPTGSPKATGVAALLEGTWSDGWHPASAELATATAAGFDVTAPEDGDWNTRMQSAKTSRNTIRFGGGQFVQVGALDGGPDKPGWQGTYTVTDEHYDRREVHRGLHASRDHVPLHTRRGQAHHARRQ